MPTEPCTGQVLLYRNCHGMCNAACACMSCMTCHTRTTRPPVWPLSQFDRNRRFLNKQIWLACKLACEMRARTNGPHDRARLALFCSSNFFKPPQFLFLAFLPSTHSPLFDWRQCRSGAARAPWSATPRARRGSPGPTPPAP